MSSPRDEQRDRQARALAALAEGEEDQPELPPGTEDSALERADASFGDFSARGADAVPPRETAAWRVEPAGIRLARTTIPACLLMAVLLPGLAIAWVLLAPVAPLKLGGGATPTVLLALGVLFGAACALLMRQVAADVRRRSGDGGDGGAEAGPVKR